MCELDIRSGAAIWERLESLDQQRLPPDRKRPSGQPGLLMRLGAYLQQARCATMLVESDCLDEEYFREYLHFYAATLLEHPPTVTRLHFFKAAEKKVRCILDPAAESVTEDDLDEAGYLGYIVLRPTSPTTVGETLLQVPDRMLDQTCYVHCATQFGQTLFGRRFRVASAPFIGQEQTGVCAHSAIWGATKYLHKYRYYPKMSMPDIAVMAAERIPQIRFLRPAQGLNLAGMYSVFRRVGFQVFLSELHAWASDMDSLPESVYTIVESGLPALLGIAIWDPEQRGWAGHHAVWVTGHTLGSQRRPDEHDLHRLDATKFRYLPASRAVDYFLVNDDNVGPYVPASFEPVEASSVEGLDVKHYRLVYHKYGEDMSWDPTGRPGKHLVISDIHAPLPEEVFVEPTRAKRMALYSLHPDDLRFSIADLSKLSADGTWPQTVPTETLEFVATVTDQRLAHDYRTYLCLSARYLEYVVASVMSPGLKRLYAQELKLPEYVWVTEVRLTDGSPASACVVGEVLVDSTDSTAWRARNRPQYLSLHIPGIVMFQKAAIKGSTWHPEGPHDLHARVVSDDCPYGSFEFNSDHRDPPRSHRKLGPPRQV